MGSISTHPTNGKRKSNFLPGTQLGSVSTHHNSVPTNQESDSFSDTVLWRGLLHTESSPTGDDLETHVPEIDLDMTVTDEHQEQAGFTDSCAEIQMHKTDMQVGRTQEDSSSQNILNIICPKCAHCFDDKIKWERHVWKCKN